MIIEQRFVTFIFVFTYTLLAITGSLFLLSVLTLSVLGMYFTTSFLQHKTEGVFQSEMKAELLEIKKIALKAQQEAELANQKTSDLNAKVGFKSLTK